MHAYSKQLYSKAIYRFLGDVMNADGAFQDMALSAAAGLPKTNVAARSFVCTVIMASGKGWNDVSFTGVSVMSTLRD